MAQYAAGNGPPSTTSPAATFVDSNLSNSDFKSGIVLCSVALCRAGICSLSITASEYNVDNIFALPRICACRKSEKQSPLAAPYVSNCITISTLSASTASCKPDLPRSSLISGSPFASNKIRIRFGLPVTAHKLTGVLDASWLLDMAFNSGPSSRPVERSAFTISSWPSKMLTFKTFSSTLECGVIRLCRRLVRSQAAKTLTTSRWPLWAAIIIGVKPICVCGFGSTASQATSCCTTDT
mmetsp:Transcript_49962/g.112467  ORF Transcript_49962/g.112467 Transcript_49962/m.112467 type:complete len:239 (+) Transcript_49962:526-1242(+)